MIYSLGIKYSLLFFKDSKKGDSVRVRRHHGGHLYAVSLEVVQKDAERQFVRFHYCGLQ